jgi:CO/xanthine dehydrogenase FAD-binding subunit
MDLDCIGEIIRPATRQELPPWREGDAWLAGGTWLFSEPQPHLRRLIDLDGFAWPSLSVGESELEIAATCRIGELQAFDAPAAWLAARCVQPCCDALLASFKVLETATVGGNLCLALPAGALVALAVALQGRCTIWQRDGGERVVPASAFVTGIKGTVLRPGELLRSLVLPGHVLRQKTTVRQTSIGPLGLSTALLIGTSAGASGEFSLTITAATRRPVRLDFAAPPDASEMRAAIDRAVPSGLYFDDAHGTASYRRHLTYHHAEDIRREMSSCR